MDYPHWGGNMGLNSRDPERRRKEGLAGFIAAIIYFLITLIALKLTGIL